MCVGPRARASMLSMPAAAPHATSPWCSCVYVNFAVGNALAQRLMESCLVALVSAESAIAGRQWHGGYDVVVLCPYLTEEERAQLLAACAEQDPPPAVLELSDEPEAARPARPAGLRAGRPPALVPSTSSPP